MADLHQLAAAISDSSANVKAFAVAVANVLQPVPVPVPSAAWRWDAQAAKLDPNSAAMMATWRGYAIGSVQVFAGPKWGVATTTATAVDPSYTILLLKQRSSLAIRCPLGTLPAKPYYHASDPEPYGDSHLAIYDLVSGHELNLWEAEIDAVTRRIKQASAGVAFPLGSVTAGTPGYSGDAANFPLSKGLVTLEEYESGVIDHPLVFGNKEIGGTPTTFRYPAIHNAPTPTNPGPAGHLVEGSWLRLPASYDTSPLTGFTKALANAAKKWGMLLRDNAGVLSIYGEDPVNRGRSWPWTENPSLASFPWKQLELLSPPVPVA